MPYFMNKSEWYDFDFNKKIFVLTKFASKKAKEDYKEFYKDVYNG